MSKKITQEQLGRLIGRKRPLISYIEQTGVVNRATLDSICKVLNISKSDLLQQSDLIRPKESNEVISKLRMENQYLLEEKIYLHEINQLLKSKVNELEEQLKELKRAN